MNTQQKETYSKSTKGHMHDSAYLHVSGKAMYTDDLPKPSGTLHAAVLLSSVACADNLKLSIEAVRNSPGVLAVLTADGIPGENDTGPVLHDEPLLADSRIEYHGQPLLAVAARSRSEALDALKLAKVECTPLKPVLTIEDAIASEKFIGPEFKMEKGDAVNAINNAPRRLKRTYNVGGQDHFYLEGQAALAIPGESSEMTVYSSTQHPTETQHILARLLGVKENQVVVEVRRMGGGFGGKETQANQTACIAALLARKTGSAVMLRLDRDTDMVMTGKRHEFMGKIDCGFDDDGRILVLDSQLWCRGGWSADLSMAIVNRAMFHSDSSYFIPDMRVRGRICRTNTVSNTAFRGFGGPQGMLFTEMLIDDIAHELGKDPMDIRRINFYTKKNNLTHYGQTVEDFLSDEICQELANSSDYQNRRQAIKDWNSKNIEYRRGLSLTPVKFGISFTMKQFNQASALINIYSDGTVQLNHGGTEMGQGLFIKVAQVVAQELGISLDNIRPMATNTGKVPNTSATAASSGADLNGMAAQDAAIKLRMRLAALLAQHYNVPISSIFFTNGSIDLGDGQRVPFTEAVKLALANRVQLTATGHYITPKIHWDAVKAQGRPFFYYAYGAAVTEVIVDTLTGEYKIVRADLLHDCGESLNEAIDIGQVEGGYIQGCGWLTTEELHWTSDGRLTTHAPSTYKIPTCRDIPKIFNTRLYCRPNSEETIYRSKAVGEPPFMLAISTFLALKDAVGSFADEGQQVLLDAPATPERVLLAIEGMKQS